MTTKKTMTMAHRAAIIDAQNELRAVVKLIEQMHGDDETLGADDVEARDAAYRREQAEMTDREDLLRALMGERLFMVEFSRQGTMMPVEILDALDAGELVDISWHNDAMPSFECAGLSGSYYDDCSLRLWVSPRHPMAEYDDAPLYAVNDLDITHVETDDFAVALGVLKAEAQRVLQRKEAERLDALARVRNEATAQHPNDCASCTREFGEDYVGACTHVVSGRVADELNPAFLFNTTATGLLVQIVAGTVDPLAAARQALADRGLDHDGKWIGFARTTEAGR